MGNVYIFVHGLSGWGSYDAACRRMPCWGMRGGDLMEYLRGQGFDCHAASVAPEGSAWDQACPEPGVWNVYPTLRGDHMRLQGGLLQRHDVRGFYVDLLTMLRETDPA